MHDARVNISYITYTFIYVYMILNGSSVCFVWSIVYVYMKYIQVMHIENISSSSSYYYYFLYIYIRSGGINEIIIFFNNIVIDFEHHFASINEQKTEKKKNVNGYISFAW